MTDLKQTLRTTPKYIEILKQNGIVTVKDFLQYFPRGYEDREHIKTISELLCDGKTVESTKGKILEKKQLPRGNKKIYEISFQDEQGGVGYVTYFNTYFPVKKLEIGKWYIIVGKPTFDYGKTIFRHPECIETKEVDLKTEGEVKKELMDDSIHHNLGRIYPLYSEMLGIKPSWFAKNNWKLLDQIPHYFREYLPEPFLEKFGLMNVPETVQHMHYPSSFTTQAKAIQRVFFDRLLRIQLHSLLQKQSYEAAHPVSANIGLPDRDIVKHITDKLPFTLTHAQKKVLKQIIEDFHDPRGKAMMRLLQGDVGSGKTIVAAIAAYYIVKKFGGQTCFLAPLSILADQHHKSLAKLLLPLGLRIELLAGNRTKGEKEKIKQCLREGTIDVLVGTHAILQEDVHFHDLHFAVVDEQHKFGVRQRAFFKQFGSPHLVQMSATPIPRSMALAFFGEFEVSIIDELPAGRKPITTKIVSEKERKKLIPWILDKISKGQKVFIVTPLIEESDKMDDVSSAVEEFHTTLEEFPTIRHQIGLLHGKIKPKEKDEIMKSFKDGKLTVLVSTTVIEVGVDIPEATIMIIKNSERFGLSQLHQLRGRIGRSDLQSYCFLETAKKSGDTYKRLQAMEETGDGFKLAEIDLQYRGAGEILGTRQSGETDIPLEILGDISFIEKVQEGAQRLLQHYPQLKGLPGLQEYLEEKIGDMMA